MTIRLPGDPLEEELAQLAQWLQDCPDAMGLEMLDGFFTALLCGPGPVMPSEFLPHVLGEEMNPPSFEQGLEWLIGHWNATAQSLAGALASGGVHPLIFTEGEDGVPAGNDWAIGFIEGMSLRPEGWGVLAGDDEHGGALVPILMLANEHHPDPELRSPDIDAWQRRELLETMVGDVMLIYRYFREQDTAGGRLRRPRKHQTLH